MDRFMALSPTDITPDYSYFPWTQTLVNIVGGIQANVIIICVAMLIIGAAMVGAGKLQGNKMVASIGWGVLVTMIIVVAIAASAPQIIDWATQQTVVNTGAFLLAPGM